jgi:2-polyprenyl-3-methyl-5-hydroxy-6-metoxy-1,4-benzoquinol methylase
MLAPSGTAEDGTAPLPADAAVTGFARDIAAAGTPSDFLAAWFARPLLPPAEQAEFDGYYVRFRRAFGPRLRHWYDRQLAELRAALAERPGARVLEIGMGTATESLWMATQGAEVTGVEPHMPYVRVARARQAVLERALGRRLPLTILTRSVLDLEPGEGFDIVWMEMTFHHLEPREAMVRHITRLLAPGGRLIISEVNGLNPLLQAQFFRQRGFRTLGTIPGPDGEPIPYGFERVLTAGRLVRHFRAAGLAEVEATHFRLLPAHPVFDRFFALEKRLSPLAPRFANTHYNVTARKPATVS